MTPGELLGHLWRVVAIAGVGPLIAAFILTVDTGIAPMRALRRRKRSHS